jgi:hypothetical protein
MPTLGNPRREKFALALSEGKSASQAYIDAGYKPCRQNAARMMTNDDIKARIAELQAGAAAKAEVTLETILAELADAAVVAKDRGQAQALVSAAMSKAKLLGLDVQRIEVGGPRDFDKCETVEQVTDKFMAVLIERFLPVDEADKQAFMEMHKRHWQEQQAWLAEIEARPHLAYRINARDLSKPWDQHETRKPPLRLGYNGSVKG